MFNNGISIIGAGNVANHIAIAISKANINIKQIVSKTKLSAEILAQKVNAKGIHNLKKFDSSVDLIIVSVNDDAIFDVISEIDIQDTLIVHTAGSIDMNIFDSLAQNYGVLYPVQTFSKEKEIDFSNVPICIEANNEFNNDILKQFSKKISSKVIKVSSVQRKNIHLSAVFACNFVNHMYNIAAHLLNEDDISFDILKPLISETAIKVMNNSPQDMQTGPAIRNDKIVIENHLESLNNDKELQKIYRFVSENIKNINI